MKRSADRSQSSKNSDNPRLPRCRINHRPDSSTGRMAIEWKWCSNHANANERPTFSEFDGLRANFEVGISALQVGRELFEKSSGVAWCVVRIVRSQKRRHFEVRHRRRPAGDRIAALHRLRPIAEGLLHQCRDIERSRVPETGAPEEPSPSRHSSSAVVLRSSDQPSRIRTIQEQSRSVRHTPCSSRPEHRTAQQHSSDGSSRRHSRSSPIDPSGRLASSGL